MSDFSSDLSVSPILPSFILRMPAKKELRLSKTDSNLNPIFHYYFLLIGGSGHTAQQFSVPKLQSCLDVGVENSGPKKAESGKFGGKYGMNWIYIENW